MYDCPQSLDSMRNPTRMVNDYTLAVTLLNTTGSIECLVNTDDAPKFANKRLRWLNCHVMTTAMVGDYELGFGAANVILGLPRHIVVSYADGNPFNLTTDNLELVKGVGSDATMKPNRIYYRKDGAAYLALRNDAFTVTVSGMDVGRIAEHQWYVVKGNKIICKYADGIKQRSLTLERYILGLDGKDPRGVTFKNKDNTDFRRANLVITQRKRKPVTLKRVRRPCFVDQNGKRIPMPDDLPTFCQGHHLAYDQVVKLVSGSQQIHQGWTYLSEK